MYDKKDLLGLRELEKEDILYILDTAQTMKEKIDTPSKRDNSLNRASVVTLFFEDSTRTKMSFLMAAEFLGAGIHDLGVSTSSVTKGESLVDTGRNLDMMGINVMVMRHQQSGAAHLLARNVKARVINAGDGANEHPTQALLDLMTIREKKSGFKGLKVVILGDINHSRVARSNVFGLTKLGANVVLTGPSTLVSGSMRSLGVEFCGDFREAIRGADIVMALRIQLERQKAGAFPNLREYRRHFGVNENILGGAKPDALIMHPGPVNRGVELTADVIDGKRSVIYEQVENGVAVRMALLKMFSEGSA
jgi:aspartate carbamoyltransferase catalytic subunit